MTPEAKQGLRRAYDVGRRLVSDDATSNAFPAESWDLVLAVEEHRWCWRPRSPRLILVAESHTLSTQKARLGIPALTVDSI